MDLVLVQGPNQLHSGPDFFAYSICIHYLCHLHCRSNQIPIPSSPWNTHRPVIEYFPDLVPSQCSNIRTLFSQPLFLPFTFLLLFLPPDLLTSHPFKSLLCSPTQMCSDYNVKKILCLIKIFPNPSPWTTCFQWQLMKEIWGTEKNVNSPL